MKHPFLHLIAPASLLAALPSFAATHYVDVNSATPIPPYTNWATAANVIQDAVDAAGTNDTVLVTNGVYDTGGKAVYGTMTNRVAVDKPLSLLSVNGPVVTIIEGHQVPGGPYGDGDRAVRCAFLTDNAVLSGFTLTNGATRIGGNLTTEQCGAGVWCSPSGVVSNCILVANSAWNFGGGAYQGTLINCTFFTNLAYGGGAAISSTLSNCTVASNWAERLGGGVRDCTLSGCILRDNRGWNGGGGWGSVFENCLIYSNSAGTGGGAEYSTLNNCTVVGNTASNLGSGVDGSTVHNSIIYFNNGPNYSGSSIDFCCTTPDPGGSNNTVLPPLFVNPAGIDFHLLSASPCINTGKNDYVPFADDLDANPRIVDSVVDMGCYEFQSVVPFIVSIEANGTSAVTGFPLQFTAQFLGGLPTSTRWDFGDGLVISNALSLSHSWVTTGAYPVVLTAFNNSNPGGVSGTVTVHIVQQVIRYVRMDNPSPVPPYTNWALAAANIQDALDAASSGDLILVTNGTYGMGGRAVTGNTTVNRAAVDKAVTLQSVNGAAATVIDGFGAARCVYLADGATLAGFTLTNGFTDNDGGAVLCASASNTVSECVLASSMAARGGGSYGGTLNHCVFLDNNGGGAFSSTLNHCALTNNDRAAEYSTLSHCILSGNAGAGIAATYYCNLSHCLLIDSSGRGAWRGTLTNCLLAGNNGFACSGSALVNCTVVGNTNGLYDCVADNCLVYYNDTVGGFNYVSDGELGYNVMKNCCTWPDPGGTGNITNAPLLVNSYSRADLRLQSNSPCINAGNNSCVTTTNDLDGNPRIQGGTVDMGAYEFQSPQCTISYAYLQQYGLPTDGSVDDVDVDGDLATTWEEWKMWTNPTNELSVLRMLTPEPQTNGTVVSWQSVSGQSYRLERATHGTADFTLLKSDIAGEAGTTKFTDTTATNGDVFLYRVGVPE